MPIYSIGHGGRTFERLVDTMTTYEVGYLIDVRSVPYSKYQPWSSKRPLERALRATELRTELRYVFMGDVLGGMPKDPDVHTDGRVDYDKLARTPRFLQGLERLLSAHAQSLILCLLCAEGKPERCHRTRLIGRSLERRGVRVQHILPDNAVVDQTTILPESRQQSLFDVIP